MEKDKKISDKLYTESGAGITDMYNIKNLVIQGAFVRKYGSSILNANVSKNLKRIREITGNTVIEWIFYKGEPFIVLETDSRGMQLLNPDDFDYEWNGGNPIIKIKEYEPKYKKK